ncbi:SRPBCC family protein [Arthrobacter sp. UYEF36]|uniref:SRPBCC family protein n=1 Tax=Arthrobacter sp. UYEF36 TaxID=1756366 RepID=UPI0033955EE7
MPGDELVKDPYLTTTRAVATKAGPGSIWPWLVQLGDGRGGLYSYDVLDRAFGVLSGPSADRILPEFQRLAAGDVIPLGKGPDWPVALLQPERDLVLEPVPGRVSWCFALHPERDVTRLVSRVRIRIYTRGILWMLAPLIDACWFIMERKKLLGIRQRAEALDRSAVPPAP